MIMVTLEHRTVYSDLSATDLFGNALL